MAGLQAESSLAFLPNAAIMQGHVNDPEVVSQYHRCAASILVTKTAVIVDTLCAASGPVHVV
jgi:hypothetical protein